MNLFRTGSFKLRYGDASFWKIDCDALVPADWATLALMAREILPPYGEVRGIPRGGVPFAAALEAHATPDCQTLLLADDVLTTGASLVLARGPGDGREVVGVVVFARGECPDWVTPLFQFTGNRK